MMLKITACTALPIELHTFVTHEALKILKKSLHTSTTLEALSSAYSTNSEAEKGYAFLNNWPKFSKFVLQLGKNTQIPNTECQFLPANSSSLPLTASQDALSKEKEINDLHLGLMWSSKFQRELGVSFRYGVQVTSTCSQPLRNSRTVSHHPAKDHLIFPIHDWFFPHLALYLPVTPTIPLNPAAAFLHTPTFSKHHVETKTDLQGSQLQNSTEYLNHISHFGHDWKT